MTAEDWVGDIIGFWFALAPEQWWKPDAELDAEIAERFGVLREEQRQKPAEAFLGSAREALAAVLLFDQVPRNIARGDAESFATDPLALAVAKGAVERGYDGALSKDQRTFLYMPFEHSEVLDDQERSLLLFTTLGDPELLRFAKLHHDVIARFGRFPHRNIMLGRTPRAEELAAGDVTPW